MGAEMKKSKGPSIHPRDAHRDENRYLHREGGPAFVSISDDKYWYWHGALHRKDGPAVEGSDGRRRWFLYGEEYEPMAWLLKLHEMGIE